MESESRNFYQTLWDIEYKTFKLQEEDHFQIVQKIMILLTVIVAFNGLVLKSLLDSYQHNTYLTALMFLYFFTQISSFLISLRGFNLQTFKRFALEEDWDKLLNANDEELYGHVIAVIKKMYVENKKNLEFSKENFKWSFWLFISGIPWIILIFLT